jgi:hypothetical protein
MDFKTPYDAVQMGKALIATALENVPQRTRAGPLLDWLRATCVRSGANAANRLHSLMDQVFLPTTPDARVVTWIQARLLPYRKDRPSHPVVGTPAAALGTPSLPAGTLSTQSGEKEYSLLETSKIQAACGLTDAQWDTDLPELYTRMLEEGRTTARIKALLEDTFRPDDMFSLSLVYLGVTADMAKDLKELNFGYNNDLSYDTATGDFHPSRSLESLCWRPAKGDVMRIVFIGPAS